MEPENQPMEKRRKPKKKKTFSKPSLFGFFNVDFREGKFKVYVKGGPCIPTQRHRNFPTNPLDLNSEAVTCAPETPSTEPEEPKEMDANKVDRMQSKM